MNASLSVVCYKSKTLSNGENPLMLQVSRNGKRKYQSLGISVSPIHWDFKKNKPKPSCPNVEYIQKIITDSFEWYGLEADNDVIKSDIAGKEFGAQNGVEYIKLPKEDMDKFYSLVARDAAKEAQKLDAKGIPATKIYTEIQRLIKEAK